ncbi:ATP-grasp domain-containing protein [Spirosoma rhododendri]|uniref:ATP-grasp domain-containing protein n=1 Tax=Spirosoma rhododendri TaxID=2728024 RepID=A0A7L5DJM8_9BACT|nr:hypothetical protein [Spirosoma rhododendri]QJD77671.1 hypothetical protein HH216_04000 [Spirosoma rhododendri]
MVLIWGIPSESPIQRLLDELDTLDQPYLAVSQRHFAETNLHLTVDASGTLGGELAYQQRTYPLDAFTGVYLRLTDENTLPEYRCLAADDPLRTHAHQLIQSLTLWTEWSGCRTVNKLSAMASNNSKPYQAQFIRQCGFLTPDTLITNEPAEVTAFCQQHNDRIIYKSISGVRSIVQTWQANGDADKLALVRHCPVQFQRQVEGFDVRVHVIGELCIATRITAQATDYRYALQQTGESAQLSPYELDDDLSARCVDLSRTLDLDFSGIDLRIAPNGSVYCFEVNPCPAYTYYESHTGQPIAARLAEYLSGHDNYYRRVWQL